jgi:hypothetical protein
MLKIFSSFYSIFLIFYDYQNFEIMNSNPPVFKFGSDRFQQISNPSVLLTLVLLCLPPATTKENSSAPKLKKGGCVARCRVKV